MAWRFLLTCSLFHILAACSNGNSGQTDASTAANPPPSGNSGGAPAAPGTAAPSQPPNAGGGYSSYMSLPWEARVEGSRVWSLDVFLAIDQAGAGILDGAQDIHVFCSKYASLARQQKLEVWATLFAEIAFYESAWNLTSRYHETTMGTDSVTGKPVYSEGLLQLSYQDIRSYPKCAMNWTLDSKLAATDGKKTIFNPQINLACGVSIMADQLVHRKAIVVSSGAYWSTLESGNSHNRIKAIENATQAISFCN